MADLDAELLALAGDDSSGEESYSTPPKRKSPSSNRPNLQPRDSPPPETSRKGTTKSARQVRRRRDDSEDDGELSSPSRRSDSASMSESESEAEYKATEGPIFPYEKLYYDAADKARIQAKPEIEREEILAQRSEQVERHEQDLTLRRLVAARAKEEAKNVAKNKRKAAAADLEDNQRKSSRQRTKLGGGRAGEASSAIEAYKQQRAEKSLRDEQRRRDAANRKDRSPVHDDSSADGEAESDDYDDRAPKYRSPTPPKDDPPAELVDIQRVKVGRDNFAQVAYYPGMEEALKDCYARVCLGPGRTPGVNEYRLCRIDGFTTGIPYAMQGSNGRPFPVNKYVMAAHGKARKAWSFLECSMSKFTEDEWRRYRLTMVNEHLPMPTKSFLSGRIDAINGLINHRFTEAEITTKMKQQHSLEAEIYKTEEKEAVREKILQARLVEDWDLVDTLEEQLAAIKPLKLAFNTTLTRPESTYVNREQEKLAELNRRNQKLNAENVRKAQLAEMRARRHKKHLAPGVDELFEGGSDISRSGTPVNGGSTSTAGTPIQLPTGTPRAGTPNPLLLAASSSSSKGGVGTPGRPGTPVPAILKPLATKSRLPQIRKAALDDEILAATLDLGIEIEI